MESYPLTIKEAAAGLRGRDGDGGGPGDGVVAADRGDERASWGRS